MNIKNTTLPWRQYEAGREFKRRLGVYKRLAENRKFYLGDQWSSGASPELPHPVFNVVRRIADYLICSAAAEDVKITYTDENLPFAERRADKEAISAALETLNRNAAYRWERQKLAPMLYRALTDAAISGDGVFFCSFDPDAEGAGLYGGDIVTETVDGYRLFAADMNRDDIQSQDYIMISGRTSVLKLKREAREAGLPESEVARICPDSDPTEEAPGDAPELDAEGSEKVTYLIKFYRDPESGLVCFEKCTRDVLICRVKTPMRLYPVARFCWQRTPECFHGTSPISGLVPNQRYINTAYAMLMKHMSDTAFSKVIYDRSRIPEWTNRVGEAIASVGGGAMSDAVTVVEPGRLGEGYFELIESVMAATKELSGATETSLGNVPPSNTSAILALKDISLMSLSSVRSNLNAAIEELANIWVDMMCAYYPDERLIRTEQGGERVNMPLLRSELIHARVDVTDRTSYSSSGTQAVLDRLLDGGHITLAEYLERLPASLVPAREALIEAHSADGGEES